MIHHNLIEYDGSFVRKGETFHEVQAHLDIFRVHFKRLSVIPIGFAIFWVPSMRWLGLPVTFIMFEIHQETGKQSAE